MAITTSPTTSSGRYLRPAASTQRRPACEADPQGWDLDHGGLTDWLRAIRTCTSECPLLQQCWEARNRQYPSASPAGVIWAGTAFTETGEPLTPRTLVEYASAGNQRRRQAHRAVA
jgi:hypothetical protein